LADIEESLKRKMRRTGGTRRASQPAWQAH
jgi:hypothetical protein